MGLLELIIIIAVGLFILALIMFPEFRTLVKGLGRVFVRDLATTPEGAAALYQEKIDQAQDAYSKADDALKRAAGKLSTAEADLKTLKGKLKKVESECEAFVKDGKIDLAQLKAEEREEIVSDIERCTELVNAYQAATNEAKEVQEMCETNLRKLKKEAKDVVENMKVKKQLKEVYDDMDELKATTSTDKLLESVREKNKELDQIAAGSRVVHENKASTKIQKAEKEAKRIQSNEYLNSLRQKYNK